MISATSYESPAKRDSGHPNNADRDLDLFSNLFSVPVAPLPAKTVFAPTAETDAAIRVLRPAGSSPNKVAFVAEDGFPAFGQEKNSQILKSGASVDAKISDGSILEGFPFFNGSAEKFVASPKPTKSGNIVDTPDLAKLADDGDLLDLFKNTKTGRIGETASAPKIEDIDETIEKPEISAKAAAPITPATPTRKFTASEFQILEVPANPPVTMSFVNFEKTPNLNAQNGDTTTPPTFKLPPDLQTPEKTLNQAVPTPFTVVAESGSLLFKDGNTLTAPMIAPPPVVNETKNIGKYQATDSLDTPQRPISGGQQLDTDFLQLETVDEQPSAFAAAADQSQSVTATAAQRGRPLAELPKSEKLIADRLATHTPLVKAEDPLSSTPLATTFNTPRTVVSDLPKRLFDSPIKDIAAGRDSLAIKDVSSHAKAEDMAIPMPTNDLPLIEKIAEPLRFTFSDDDGGALKNVEAENAGLGKKLDMDLPPTAANFGSEIKLTDKVMKSSVEGNTKTDLNERILDQIGPRVIDLAAMTPSGKEKRIMKMRLNPADLGTVEITLEKSSSGTISAHFRTESHATQQVLNESLVRLRESLETAGLQVGDLNTSCSAFSSSGSEHGDERPREFAPSELPPVGIPSFDGISKSDDGLKDRLVNLRA